MSCQSCSVKNCDAICCMRYSKTYGFICEYCFNDMLNEQSNNNKFNIQEFLLTSKQTDDTDKNLYTIFEDTKN